MYHRQFGIFFSKRNKSQLFVFATILWLFNSGCSSSNARWKWVNQALEPVSSSSGAADSIVKSPNFKSHQFLNPDFQRHLDHLSNSYLSAGNEVKILANRSSSEAKIALINSARSSIYIATHEIVCDEGGHQFLSALAKAARRGVDVRIIFDGGFWGSLGGICTEEMQNLGIQVARSIYTFMGTGIDMKLHDKIFIVDGEIGITGGQNIGSWWSDSNGEDDNFRDTDIWAKGPVVNQMALRFVHMWKTVRPTQHGLSQYERSLSEKWKDFADRNIVGIKNYAQWLSKATPKGLCRFVGQDPHLGTHYVFDIYTALAQASRSQIIFHVPSLNGIGSPEQEALLTALVNVTQSSNVDIDIITNGPGLMSSRIVNKRLGWLYGIYTLGRVYDSVKDTLLNIYVHKYWLHSKLFNFDGVAIAVGSFNFDETGVDWMESTLICMDADLSSQANLLLKNDFAHSRLLPKPRSDIESS